MANEFETVRVIALEDEASGPEAGQYLLIDSSDGTKKMPVENLLQAAALSEDAKTALLDCFAHVAWTDEHGQDYYDALEDALYPDTGLVRIDAVFTQGSLVVYEDTPLDDLKAYLVVTGYYGNGTSRLIYDYTLSGTLTVGTSAITVSREGKTDTFDVIVSAPYWDYQWNSSSGVLPTGLQTSAYNFTDDPGVLYADSPNLNLNYIGNMIFQIECKWFNQNEVGVVVGNVNNPQINIAKTEVNNERSGARIIGSSKNGDVSHLIRVDASGSLRFTNIYFFAYFNLRN